jgi:hypothetical protein
MITFEVYEEFKKMCENFPCMSAGKFGRKLDIECQERNENLLAEYFDLLLKIQRIEKEMIKKINNSNNARRNHPPQTPQSN